MNKFKKVLIVFVIALSISSLLGGQIAQAAFDRSRLIDDSLFADTDSMTVAQIQSFLESQGSLLANWRDDVNMRRPGDNCIVHHETNKTAAQIIYEAANNWGAQVYNSNGCAKEGAYWSQPAYSGYKLKTISPKALLVTLQKEQSLLTANGSYSQSPNDYKSPDCCSSNEYKLAYAMGYGVPDSGSINKKYLGFYNQVMWGAWQLRFNFERSAGNTSWDGVGNITYGGPMVKGTYRRCSSCSLQKFDGYATIDGKSFLLETRATASLYYYTPHTYPGFFGNYNFVNYYEQWFGPTKIVKVSNEPLKYPRNTSTYGDFDNDGYDDLATGMPGEDIGPRKDAGAVAITYGSASGLSTTRHDILYQGSGLSNIAETGDYLGASTISGDFNNDGYDDLAIGAPGEDTGGAKDAGLVNVIYGSASGLDRTTSASLLVGTVEATDYAGSSLASGDINNDNFADLIIGLPGEDVAGGTNTGAVIIYYGSGSGIVTAGQDTLYQGSNLQNVAESNDYLGTSVASGDFDNDGYDDVVIGSPGKDLDYIYDGGAVHVAYGSSGGIASSGSQFLAAGADNGLGGEFEYGDFAGAAVAVGDFDNDTYDDIALGMPGEDFPGNKDAGALKIVYGSNSGINTSDSQTLYQGYGLSAKQEPGDYLGSSLVSGRFNNDSFDDLAIGLPGEDIGAIKNAGAVSVAYGSGSGLSPSSQNLFYQSATIDGRAEASDFAGATLSIGDFNNDGYFELVIGIPGEDVWQYKDAGAMVIVPGSATGLVGGQSKQTFPEHDAAGRLEAGDYFGGGIPATLFW